MEAMLRRLAGVRNIAEHCSSKLGTSNFTSLTHAFRRASGTRLLLKLIGSLEPRTQYRSGEFVALDSMAVTFGKTRRHRCKDFNNHAAGGGVLWSYQIRAKGGTCPVRLIKLMRGAWNDAGLMKGVKLEANGPIYLMDRGFYAIDLIRQWLTETVRFIVRVKAGSLRYEIVRHLSQGGPATGGWHIELDAMVILGTAQRGNSRPQVRLIIARSKTGEVFAYATSENGFSAEQVIASYKQRWQIEKFHRFLKNNLGLAHIYSYDATGLEFMILTAMLTAMLLFTLADSDDDRETLKLLHTALSNARNQLGLTPVWQRNILAVKRSTGKRKR